MPEEQWLRIRDLENRGFGSCRRINELVSEGIFPAPVMIGPTSPRWALSTIQIYEKSYGLMSLLKNGGAPSAPELATLIRHAVSELNRYVSHAAAEDILVHYEGTNGTNPQILVTLSQRL